MAAQLAGLTADGLAQLAAGVLEEWLQGYVSITFEDGPETQYRVKYEGEGVYRVEEAKPFQSAPRRFRIVVSAEEVDE